MFAFCPSCRRPAVLDLRASMFHPVHDFYSCAQCSLRWTVEKISGRATFPTYASGDGQPRRTVQ